jgi:hypothetical protein
MIAAITDRIFRLYMFFFVPFALVGLAFPGRYPLRQGARRSRPEKPTPVPAYLGPELGNKPYRAEVGPRRHSAYRRFALAR